MDHGRIIKKSFLLVIRNKYLWLLGFLGGSSYTGWSFYSFPSPGSNGPEPLKFDAPKDTVLSTASVNYHKIGRVLGESIDPQSSISTSVWVIIILATLLIVLLAIYLSIVAKGAIVKSAHALDDGEKYSFKRSWSFGHRYFWRRLSFALTVFLIIVIAITIAALPAIVFAVLDITVLAVIFAIILGITLLAFMVYMCLILPLAERILFLKNEKTITALVAGAKMFNKNWINIILLYLILFAIGSVVAIGLMLALLIAILIVVALNALIALASSSIATIVTVIMITAIIIALFVFVGIKKAFDSVAITLAYKGIHTTS